MPAQPLCKSILIACAAAWCLASISVRSASCQPLAPEAIQPGAFPGQGVPAEPIPAPPRDGESDGPNSSLFSGRLPPPQYRNNLFPNGTGFYSVPPTPPREVRKGDTITVRVDMAARVISEGEIQRRKQISYNAILNDWILLNGLKSIKPAPQSDGDQTVQGNLNQQNRATGELETSESLKFEIAATIADIYPNGNLILEAHREVRVNNEVWLHSLSGVVSRDSILPGNIVLSKDIADLHINKKETGHVRDSYRRGWLTRLMDTFNPF